MKRLRAWIGAPLFVLVMATGMVGCAAQAPVDKVGLYYTGGPIQGRHFKHVIEPGSGNTFLGFGDDVIWLPAGQRNYIVSKHAEEGDRNTADFIRVPAKGGVLMDFEASVYFKLNTAKSTVKAFYEQICKKYNCSSEKGWKKMLNDVFRKILETSMQEKIRQYDVGVLYANQAGAQGEQNNDVLLKIQREVGTTLKERINSVLGAPYFCGPKFDRKKPNTCPEFEFIINSAEPASAAVRASFEKIRQSQNEIQTAQNNALQRKAEAEGTAAAQAASVNALTPPYLTFLYIQALLECAKRPNCTMIASPNGANVNVNSGGQR